MCSSQLQPTSEFGNLVPDPSADYCLFDRVVNIRDGAAVPLGLRGTVVGIHEGKSCQHLSRL